VTAEIRFPLLALALSVGACDPGDPDRACQEPGIICTVAGTGEPAFNGDGLPARQTSLYWPMDIEISPSGEPFILDWQNHRVRRVRADGTIETVIGTAFVGDGPPGQTDRTSEGAPGTTVELNHPTDVIFLPDGTLVLAAWHNHKIRRWDPHSGRVHVICGSDPGRTGDDGLASRAKLSQPKAVALGPDGTLFIADSRNQRIRSMSRAEPDALITTVAGSGLVGDGGDGGPPRQAEFYMQQVNENPEPGGGLTADAQGRLYLADTFNHRIRRIDLAEGSVETIAGVGEAGFSGDGGPATAAALNHPRDLEFGPDGRLFIADTDNHRIRAIDLSTGVIETVVGSGTKGFKGDGGPATAAALDRPFGIGFGPEGALYIADTRNSRIRKVVLP
jgi:sugar lactone lactonase YvrE